jgi:hypothetical protein
VAPGNVRINLDEKAKDWQSGRLSCGPWGNNFGTDFFGSSTDQAGATRIIHATLGAA